MGTTRSPRVLLVHWHAGEAGERAARLEKAGFRAVVFSESGGAGIRRIREDPPDALVIDLGRVPSHGRQVGVYFRQQPPLRHVPLVFVAGEEARLDAARRLIPDAAFTDWGRIGPALRAALRKPVENPVVPGTMDGYSGTPLPKKLGVREETTIALVDAPEGFDQKLGELPAGTKLKNGMRGSADLLLVFVKSRASLEKRLAAAKRGMAAGGSVWFFWPKKSSGVPTDVDQFVVRRTGLAAGLVDYKICAVDETWSGLRFARRRATAKHK